MKLYFTPIATPNPHFTNPLNLGQKSSKKTHISICFNGLGKTARETVYPSFIYGALLLNPP